MSVNTVQKTILFKVKVDALLTDLILLSCTNAIEISAWSNMNLTAFAPACCIFPTPHQSVLHCGVQLGVEKTLLARKPAQLVKSLIRTRVISKPSRVDIFARLLNETSPSQLPIYSLG